LNTNAKSPKSHRGVFLGLLVFTLISAGIAGMSWYWVDRDNKKVISTSRAAAVSAVSETVRLIGERVEGLKVAEILAQELGAGNLNVRNLDERILKEISGRDDIAITVAWLPRHFPTDNRPPEDTEIVFKLGFKSGQQVDIRDGRYTKDQVDDRQHGDITSWYARAVREKRPVWLGSAYYSPVSKTWWAGGYSVPFFVDGEIAGVVAAELTVDQANRAMFTAESEGFKDSPIDSNFGILISESGTMFSHPNLNVVKEQRHISNLVPELTSPADIKSLFPLATEESEAAATGGIYVRDNFKRERTGQLLSLFFAPIGETGWWAVLMLDQQAVNRDIDNLLRVKTGTIGFFMALLALVLGLSFLLLRVDRGQEIRLWIAALIFSLLCVTGIGGVLYYSLNQVEHARADGVLLQNRAITAKAIMHHQREDEPAAIRIPTGIFIQSAKFSSANDVTVTGFVWQKYDHDLPGWLQRDKDDVKPGFILPEAEQVDIEFRYRRAAGDGWVYGWYFNAVLRQQFDYTKYPFDQEIVWIRIWHSDFGRGVILTPDLRSYSTLAPSKFPGLELQDFVLEGWDLAGTYFSFRHNDYNTDFGMDEFRGGHEVPELYFNIALKREFLNAFIMNFITITVVAFLLFAVLYTIRTDKTKTDLLGFNVSAVLGFCAALFFVVILAHTSLRETLAAQSLVYLEYYFFVMYAAFLGVSVNAIMAASDVEHPLLRLGDNLIARLAYWPLLSFSLLVVTLIIF
jgi:hypothetical protein